MENVNHELINVIKSLEQLHQNWQKEEPDETVTWAINELSEEGHKYLFGDVNKVLDAYRIYKQAIEG